MSSAELTVTTPRIPALVRRNTFLLAVAQFVAWMGTQTLATLGSVAAFQLTADQRWAGIPATLFSLSSAFAAQYAGRRMDKVGRKPVLLAGQAFAAAGVALISVSILVDSFPGFLAAIIIMGAGTGALVLARLAAADMYPISLRSQGLSLVIMGGAAGAIIGPLVLATLSGWSRLSNNSVEATLSLQWIVLLLPSTISVVALALVRPDPRKIATNLPAYYPGEAEPVVATSAPARPLAEVLRRRPIIVGVGSITLAQASMVVVMVTTSLNMKLEGYGDAIYGVMTGHFFGMLGLSFLIGRIADRLGRRPVLIAGGLALVAGAVMAPLFQNSLYNAGSLFLVGLGWSLCYVAGNTVLADATRPSERGRTVGANDMIAGITGSIAALLGGFLMGSGGYSMVAVAGLAFAVVQVALAVSLREPEPGRYSAQSQA